MGLFGGSSGDTSGASGSGSDMLDLSSYSSGSSTKLRSPSSFGDGSSFALDEDHSTTDLQSFVQMQTQTQQIMQKVVFAILTHIKNYNL